MDPYMKILELIEKLSNELKFIEQSMNTLKSDGILDEPLELYLKTTTEELSNRQNLLIEHFNLKEKINNSDMPTVKNSETSTPPFKLLSTLVMPTNLPQTSISLDTPSRENPKKFSPSLIFQKKISPLRGTSPSAQRYAPKSPSTDKIERKNRFDPFRSSESPQCSTRSSGSSLDKIMAANPSEHQALELSWKFIQQREIRNRAHEEELMLKEKMLRDMEVRLQKLKKEVSDEYGKEKERNLLGVECYKCRSKDSDRGSQQARQFFKPPRSPRIPNSKNREESGKEEEKEDCKIVRDI